MAKYLSVRDIDWPLMFIVVSICGVGVLQIYSATMDTGFHSAWWKQIFYVFGGLLLMRLILFIDYHSLMHYVPAMFVSSILALLLTVAVGDKVFGSKRWIPLPGNVHLQVSEFVKLVIILYRCRYLTDLKTEELEIWEMAKLGALVGLTVVLVLMQPDPGTSSCGLSVIAAG